MRYAGIKGVLRNAAVLLAGNAGASLVFLFSVIIAARDLGQEVFGVLVLVSTYVLLIDKLLNFNSWQAVVRYGAVCLEERRSQDLNLLLRNGTGIDLGVAILATSVAASLTRPAGSWLGWEDATIVSASLFSLVIMSNLSGVSTGVLRLFGNYKLYIVHQFVQSLVRLFGAIGVWMLDGGLNGYMIAWAAAQVAGNVTLTACAVHIARQQGVSMAPQFRFADSMRRFPGIGSFLLTTNLHGSVRLASRELDTLVVGGVVGSAGAGLYKIAKQFSSMLGRITDPVYQAIFPDLAQLFAQRRTAEFRQVVVRVATTAGLLAFVVLLGVLVLHAPVIGLIFGGEFLSAGNALVIFVGAWVIASAGLPFQPALLAMGRPWIGLLAVLVATAVYAPVLFILTGVHGIEGAATAYFAFYVVWYIVMLLALSNAIKREVGATAQPSRR